MGEYLVALEPMILVVHYITAILLIIVVLLQAGKGMGVGSMFGAGGSQSLFGARGAGNFLTKMTTITALVMLVTSLSLTSVANQKAVGGDGNSVIGKESTLVPGEVDSAEDEVNALTPAPAEGDAGSVEDGQ